jgi:hypothetical protein
MDVVLTYRGRDVTVADVAFIRALIAAHGNSSRRALSRKLCEAWGWRQPNGALKDMVCRGLMLALHRAGQIELPPPRWECREPSRRLSPAREEVDESALHCSLAELGPIELRQVRRSGDEEKLFNFLIEAHHYLGYRTPVGEHLKFLLYARGRVVACFAWSSTAVKLGPRDRFLGWSAAEQRRNLHLVAYNTRFLIPPWIRVPHLASHALGRMTRELSLHWQRVYGHPVYLAETYVDRTLFEGTCYRAANWLHIGRTTGRGKDAPSSKVTRTRKDVLVLPLSRDFRRRLQAGDRSGQDGERSMGRQA